MKASKNNLVASYNKSQIMRSAWVIFRNSNNTLTFGEALKKSWNIAKNGIKDISIDVIYKKYYSQVYFSIFTKVGNKADIAEELTNDVFIKANRHLHEYDVNKAKINTWLINIAKNIVIDYYRMFNDKNAQKLNVGDFCDSDGKEFFQFTDNSNFDSIENKELSQSIDCALSNLKPKYREVAELYFIDQKKYDEIADILDIPLGSVKGMISRARAMLQSELQAVYTN